MSTAKTVYRFRGVCPDHGTVTSEGYYENEPTLCPIDGATGWTSVRIFDELSQAKTFITDEDPNNPRNFIKTKGYNFDIPSGNTGDVTTILAYTPPLDVAAYGFRIGSRNENIGDMVTVQGPPETKIGVITQELTPGCTLIHVNSTVIDHIIEEAIIHLGNTGTTLYNVGECIAVDPENSTVTVTGSTGVTIPAFSDFRFTPVRVEELVITNNDYVTGGNKIGHSIIPANTCMRILYENYTGQAKKLNMLLSYAVHKGF